MSTADRNPPSPCTDTCEIDLDSGLCRGCYRTLDEILCWHRYTADEKHHVLAEVDKRRRLAGDGE